MDVRVGLWRKLSTEDLMLLNYCVGEDSWVPQTARRSNQSILKEISPGKFIGRTDAEAETPILWPPHAKSWLIGKDPDAGTDWRQEEKGMTEDEMVGWHYWLNGHGFGWTLGVGDGQGGLVCFSSWGLKELDMTEQLNWTELNAYSSKTISKNYKERNTSKLILWGHHHPDTKTRQRQHTKRKL